MMLRTFRTAKPVFILLAIAFAASVAQAAPLTFVEDFTGPGLDPAWTQGGNPASHPAVIALYLAGVHFGVEAVPR